MTYPRSSFERFAWYAPSFSMLGVRAEWRRAHLSGRVAWSRGVTSKAVPQFAWTLWWGLFKNFFVSGCEALCCIEVIFGTSIPFIPSRSAMCTASSTLESHIRARSPASPSNVQERYLALPHHATSQETQAGPQLETTMSAPRERSKHASGFHKRSISVIPSRGDSGRVCGFVL